MIRESGLVTAIENGIATVAILPADEHRCRACGVCRAADAGREMLIDVPAPEGVCAGERVTVEIPMPGPGRSAAILLLAPLVLFMAGIGAAKWLQSRSVLPEGDGISLLLGFGLMVLGLIAAAIYDRHLRISPKHRPRIIIDENDQ